MEFRSISAGLIRSCAFAALIAAVPPASAQTPAVGLDPAIVELLEASPAPEVLVAPGERYLLLVRSRNLLPLERLAQPAIEVAGRRLDPRTAAPHAPIEYFSLTLVDLIDEIHTDIPLPRGSLIGYPEWAPDGSRFAFSLTRPGSRMEIWVGEPAEARARPLLTGISGSRGASCSFTPQRTKLLCKRVAGSLRDFAAPATMSVASPFQAGSLQPLGPLPIEESVVSALLETQLELVDVVSGQRQPIGKPAAFDSVTAAPAGGYLLVKRIMRPYPQLSGVDPVHLVTEVWNRFGDLVTRLPADARSADWQASHPARLAWIERREGRDRVVTASPPFNGRARIRHQLDGRFAGLRWLGDRDAALLSDYDPATRTTTLKYVPIADGAANEGAHSIATSRSTRSRIPLMGYNRFGVASVRLNGNAILLRGNETVEGKRRVTLDRVDIDSGAATRLWQSAAGQREELIDVLGHAGDYLLVRRETPISPPNVFMTRLADNAEIPVTEHEHPAPALVDTARARLEYERNDGTALSASLYLPPDMTPGERLPLIVWAYPTNVLAGSDARLPDTTDHFPTFKRAFRHFFLLRGYAILDDVSMPIIGDDATANDTFIEQVVENAEAAVRAAVETGTVDFYRVGVAGHSYGAFMVANLLAHSRLFSAGVALSGAYNRTLTPFGFQTERRTLWDAPETYVALSPVIFANQVDAPLLLVHGLLDDNAGTSPIQSTQFFQAIRGNGGTAELLLLPWEGHQYRARESVLKTAAGMLEWFDRHMPPSDSVRNKNTGAFLRP